MQTLRSLSGAALATLISITTTSASDDRFETEIRPRLRAVQEPELEDIARNTTTEIYRMMALPSFHRPIVIRVAIARDGATATVRMTNGTDGDIGKEVVAERTVIATPADAAALREAMGETFERVPTNNKTLPYPVGEATKVTVCADGTLIVLESVRAGRYHRVMRHCSMEPALGSVVETFKRIARRHLPPNIDDYVP